MEDVLKFLAIAAFVVIGLVKQFKKEAEKNTESKPATPVPNVDIPTAPPPLPKGFVAIKKLTTPLKKQVNNTQARPSTSAYTPVVSPTKKTTLTSPLQETEESSEFAIHSVEEARRAIIWSEILQRKYC